MPRIRSIKPSLPASFSLSHVSIQARYLFTAMFTLADDDGRMIDSPKQIVGDLFPHDRRVNAGHVERWLKELEQVDSIRRYTAGGGRYLYFPEWRKHQRISHPTPSIFPNPPGRPPANRANGSRTPPESLRPDMEREGEWEWEREGESDSGAPRESEPRRRASQLPPDFTLTDQMREWATENAPGVDVTLETKRFADHHQAKGSTFKDWIAAWRNWLRKEAQWSAERGRARPRRDQEAEDVLGDYLRQKGEM